MKKVTTEEETKIKQGAKLVKLINKKTKSAIETVMILDFIIKNYNEIKAIMEG